MNLFIKKYKGLILLVFLGLLISLIDNIILKGFFKGDDLIKHVVYVSVLLAALIFVIYILIKE